MICLLDLLCAFWLVASLTSCTLCRLHSLTGCTLWPVALLLGCNCLTGCTVWLVVYPCQYTYSWSSVGLLDDRLHSLTSRTIDARLHSLTGCMHFCLVATVWLIHYWWLQHLTIYNIAYLLRTGCTRWSVALFNRTVIFHVYLIPILF